MPCCGVKATEPTSLDLVRSSAVVVEGGLLQKVVIQARRVVLLLEVARVDPYFALVQLVAETEQQFLVHQVARRFLLVFVRLPPLMRAP